MDPPGSRRRGNNAGWLGTWNNFPLRTDSTSLKWFSTNFLIENSSSRNSRSLQVFQLLNTSNTRTRSARSRSANSSWSRACSRLDCSYPVRVCPMSTAWESICLFNSQILFSARSALYSCLRISDFASASYCSLSLSKIILNWQLSNSWLDLRFCDIQSKCSSMVQQNTRLHRDPCLTDGALRVSRSCQNWLCTLKQAFSFASDKPATGSHLLLAPECAVVKPANSWCARRQSQHLGTSRRCHQGFRLSGHSSPGRMKLLRGSLQSVFFLKVPRPLTRDFSACLPFRDLVFVCCVNLANSFHAQVSPFLHDRQTRTELATNFRQENDKLIYGPLVLLAPEWTVVKMALCRWSRHWAARHASTRTSCRWIAPGGRFQ